MLDSKLGSGPGFLFLSVLSAFVVAGSPHVWAQGGREHDLAPVITRSAQEKVDASVAKALPWIASKQEKDGSFQAPPQGQPGITSPCVMAFLSAGHLPGQGPFGQLLNRAIAFTISCQRTDGLFTHIRKLEPVIVGNNAAYAASYNHAITGLALSEVYGMGSSHIDRPLSKNIARAVHLTRSMQDWSKRRAYEESGWHYWVHPHADIDADLSVASCHLLFLRSAKNAGFDVSSERIDRAMQFVIKCFDRSDGSFVYHPHQSGKAYASHDGRGNTRPGA